MTYVTNQKQGKAPRENYTSTRNACKLCSPLGASVAFKGIQGCLPLIHGSQGCATYIRRYMISHYKEPVDIASSNFSESSAIFGGNKTFCEGIDNIISQYNPEVIAIASTCLSETIGEDIPMLISEYRQKNAGKALPYFINASTPSYKGTHIDGFHYAVRAMVESLAEGGERSGVVNVMPGFVSPEDIRHIKDVMEDFGLPIILFPDYSDTLDNPAWDKYHRIPDGGTTASDLIRSGCSNATIEFGHSLLLDSNNSYACSAGRFLEQKWKVPCVTLGLPIGIKASDEFFSALEKLSGRPMPERHKRERGRLIDAMVDAHKHVFGRRVVIYGEEDLVVALTLFALEIGLEPVLVASGAKTGVLRKSLELHAPQILETTVIGEGMDFEEIREQMPNLKPDIMLGNSKGYYMARELDIPLVRLGFPIHDRFGGQRVQHLGYKGSMQLFDTIANAIVQYKQDHSPVGYKYM